MRLEDLDRLDAEGYNVLEVLSFDPLANGPATHASPRKPVCLDGKAYWVKRTAQGGLAAELVAGRLAAKLRAGPEARVIRVRPEALPTDGSADHLEGIGVGIFDQPNTVNGRDLEKLFPPAGSFDVDVIDARSRAKVVAFQSWLGVGDSQVLIDLGKGTVYSIDHGGAFGAIDPMALLHWSPSRLEGQTRAHEI